ncbi:hypothetical protein HMPREF7545_0814 [Selenomonas noxia ATCC 43541]|nr:hypothetical protein HMPREF7545_0814 [Selenomonas noxia ATCC 43541]
MSLLPAYHPAFFFSGLSASTNLCRAALCVRIVSLTGRKICVNPAGLFHQLL